MQIVQLPDKVIFLYEYMHNYRVIYTDGRTHRPTWEPSLLGDSVGRWDGDTLVIDTVNLTDRTWLDDHGNRHSDALHVTERWRRISANELLVRGNHRRSKVLHEAVDGALDHTARAEGLGADGIRLHRQQQGPLRRPSPERAAQRLAARRLGDRQAGAAPALKAPPMATVPIRSAPLRPGPNRQPDDWPGVSRRELLRRAALAAGTLALPLRLGADGPGPVMTALSTYMASARDRALPPEVIEKAKQHILDTVRRDGVRLGAAARAGPRWSSRAPKPARRSPPSSARRC